MGLLWAVSAKHLTTSGTNKDAKHRHGAWQAGVLSKASPSDQHADGSHSHKTSQPFALSATGTPSPGHPEGLLWDSCGVPGCPPTAGPFFPTAWLAPPAMPPRAGLAVLGWAPHCYSWHEVILPASSEAHKNTRSLSLVGAAQSPVASSEKMVLPTACWEWLLPRMAWYVRDRASMN